MKRIFHPKMKLFVKIDLHHVISNCTRLFYKCLHYSVQLGGKRLQIQFGPQQILWLYGFIFLCFCEFAMSSQLTVIVCKRGLEWHDGEKMTKYSCLPEVFEGLFFIYIHRKLYVPNDGVSIFLLLREEPFKPITHNICFLWPHPKYGWSLWKL